MVDAVAEGCVAGWRALPPGDVWGKRGWARLVCFGSIEVRFASWGRMIISWSQMIIGKRTQVLDLSVCLLGGER